MSPLRIALVDDHRVVARSLQSYLESFPDMQVVGIAANVLGKLQAENRAQAVAHALKRGLVTLDEWE